MWQLVLVSPVISSQHGSIKIHILYKEVCSNMYYVNMSKEKQWDTVSESLQLQREIGVAKQTA